MLLRVLVRGELTNEQYVARAFNFGTHGYSLKSASAAGLTHAVKTVVVGRPFLDSVIGMALLRRLYIGRYRWRCGSDYAGAEQA